MLTPSFAVRPAEYASDAGPPASPALGLPAPRGPVAKYFREPAPQATRAPTTTPTAAASCIPPLLPAPERHPSPRAFAPAWRRPPATEVATTCVSCRERIETTTELPAKGMGLPCPQSWLGPANATASPVRCGTDNAQGRSPTAGPRAPFAHGGRTTRSRGAAGRAVASAPYLRRARILLAQGPSPHPQYPAFGPEGPDRRTAAAPDRDRAIRPSRGLSRARRQCRGLRRHPATRAVGR